MIIQRPIFLFLILVILPFTIQAQSSEIQPTESGQQAEIIASESGHPVLFGMLIDRDTYAYTREAIHRYRNTLETEGLAVSIVIGDFITPEEVKAEITRLHRGEKPLEGIVLIGKIPQTLIEIQGKLVLSDRFYDDPALEFEYLGPAQGKWVQHFHYRLKESEGSSGRPHPAFYLARIPYLPNLGDQAFDAIGAYLERAGANRQHGLMDHLVTYTGKKSEEQAEPNCLTAWLDEEKAFRELFPLAFQPGGSVTPLHYRMARTNPAALIASELRRPEIDIFLASDFGSWNEIQEVSVEARVMLLENHKSSFGSQLEEDFYGISQFIFNGGQTLTVRGSFGSIPRMAGDRRLIGNSNTWYLNLTGIFELGLRIGHLERFNASWESCLIGDPTFRFVSPANPQLAVDLAINRENKDTWQTWLAVGESSENPRLQALAMRVLADQDAVRGGVPEVGPVLVRTFPEELYDIFSHSPSPTVRLQALTLLSRYPGPQFTDAVAAGLLDAYEEIARLSSLYVGAIGEPRFLPALVEAMVFHPERKRVVHHLSKGVRLFPPDKVKAVFTELVGASNRLDKDREIADFHKAVDHLAVATDDSLGTLASLGQDPHGHVEEYLRILLDKEETLSVRIHIAQMLRSFRYSYNRERIVSACELLLKERRLPDGLRVEVTRTIGALSSVPYY